MTNCSDSCRTVDALDGSLTQKETRGMGWSEIEEKEEIVMPRRRFGSSGEHVDTTTTREKLKGGRGRIFD
jgi:hypothetical protein